MDFRKFALFNTVRIMLFLLILPIPWHLNWTMELPLQRGTNAKGKVFNYSLQGISLQHDPALQTDWHDYHPDDTTGISIPAVIASFYLFKIAFYLSIGFLFAAGISTIKGVTFKYMKGAKILLLTTTIVGYILFLVGVKTMNGINFASGLLTADWMLIYIWFILFVRLMLFKRQSGD